MIAMVSCSNNSPTSTDPNGKILFLHHSTGLNVWNGAKKDQPEVLKLIMQYNEDNHKSYVIEEKSFPNKPYPWSNYPYDYYNIWVKNAGNRPFRKQPTLEMLTLKYEIIIFKHCFPFSSVLADDSTPDINSSKKTIANYKLQYEAIKRKLHEFPSTRFIVWTGAALVEKVTTPEEAKRARDFTSWMISEWDEAEDNIHIFDFRQIETEGGLYLKPEYAIGELDSHPNEVLSSKAANLFVKRMIDIIENEGKKTNLTGSHI
jgi:hypothetical protein